MSSVSSGALLLVLILIELVVLALLVLLLARLALSGPHCRLVRRVPVVASGPYNARPVVE